MNKRKPTDFSDNSKGSSQRKCYVCGLTNHTFSNCKYKTYKCNNCNKIGHLAKMCKSKSKNHYVEVETESESIEMFQLKVGYQKSVEPFFVKIKIEKILIDMELGSGAGRSIIPFKFYKKYWSKLKVIPSLIKLKTYNGEIIDPIGEVMVVVEYKNKKEQCNLLIVENGCRPLLGRDLMSLFGIQLVDVSNITVNNLALLKEFGELFKEELGKYKQEKITLKIKEGVKPIFCKPRSIPFAYVTKDESELERLEKENVIEKVDNAQWGTSLVPIIKPNGTVRLCADYKTTINKYLEDYNYPVPKVEELFVALQGGKFFSKLDFINAYNQLEICEDTQKLLAWSTHKGIYKVKRTPLGTKPACSIFSK